MVRNVCNDWLIGTGAFPAMPGFCRQPLGSPACHPSLQGCWSTSVGSQTSASPESRSTGVPLPATLSPKVTGESYQGELSFLDEEMVYPNRSSDFPAFLSMKVLETQMPITQAQGNQAEGHQARGHHRRWASPA